MVHGWGMHGGFWREFAQRLGRNYRVTCLDLPGHGQSAMIDGYSPENVASLLAQSAPDKAHWIGWSLGATLVLFLCDLFPERVKTIGLVAGSPKFSSGSNWQYGLENQVLDQFNWNLIEDFNLTLLRFLKVQTFSLKTSRQTYRSLKDRLNECQPPHPEALTAGVEILKSADQRECLRTLKKPVLVLLGAKDSLVPVGVSESIKRLNPAVDLIVIEGAGHIPFITHQEKCLVEISNFLDQYSIGFNA